MSTPEWSMGVNNGCSCLALTLRFSGFKAPVLGTDLNCAASSLMAVRKGKLEILPDKNNHCGFWHPGIHFGIEIIPLGLYSKTIFKWNNAEWWSWFSVLELTTSQRLTGAALHQAGTGSSPLSCRQILSLWQQQMQTEFAPHPSRRVCSAWAPNMYEIDAATLTNLQCLWSYAFLWALHDAYRVPQF